MNDKKKPAEPVVSIPLTFVKSTKGTHVFGNEETGFGNIYIPKLFLAKIPDPSKATLRMDLTEV